MENKPSSAEADAALTEAESSAARLAAGLQLPSHFYGSIGVAIGLQIGTSAVGIAIQEVWAAVLLLVGLGIFTAVAVVQLVRFRRLNGAWVWALANKVVFGSGTAASVTYCLAFAAALVAATVELWWLVPPAAIVGGFGYALGGQRWLSAYRGDPTRHGRGKPIGWLAAAAVLATTGLVLLVHAR